MIIGRLNPTDSIVNVLIEKGDFERFQWYNGHSNAKAVYSNFIADATIEVTKSTQPTCTKDGELVFTASYDDHTESYTHYIEKLGHKWVFMGFEWNIFGDKPTAVGVFQCRRDSAHTQKINADVEVFLANGTAVATFEFDGKVYTETIPYESQDLR